MITWEGVARPEFEETKNLNLNGIHPKRGMVFQHPKEYWPLKGYPPKKWPSFHNHGSEKWVPSNSSFLFIWGGFPLP